MEYKDYYKIMGVARDASADDIKQAYRRLARKYHPDVSKEKDAEARFKEVGEAYEVLRDPEKRAAYDSLGSRPAGEEFRPPPGWEFEAGAAGLRRTLVSFVAPKLFRRTNWQRAVFSTVVIAVSAYRQSRVLAPVRSEIPIRPRVAAPRGSCSWTLYDRGI